MGKIERDKGMSQLDYLWTYYGGYIIKKEDDQDNPQYFLLTENQIDDKIKNNTQSIFQNLPIKEVSSSYFIKNDNGTIKSSISLVYKSNLIQLIGLDNQVISTIDASSFIKDGMVNNVQLITNPQGQAEGTYIVITFNTDSGLEPIYLNVTQLIDIYVGGNGISIQNNQVSIKLDTSSEEYLSISENGIKISGIKQIQETLPQVYNSLQDIELSSKFNTNKLYIDSSKSQIYIYKDNNLVLLKGLKGDPLTFDDLTEEQIAELQKPATEAISLATQAAQNAQTSAQNADNATQKATQAISNIQSVQTQFQQKEQEWQTAEATRQDNETKRVTAENVRVTEFSQIQSTANSLIEETTTAKNNAVEATTNANKATENANTATEKANTAAASANEAATAANNAAQKVDDRVTALEGKASQTYANLSEIQNSGDKNVNKIYIDKETNTSYRYDSSSDSYVNIGATLPDNLAYVEEVISEEPSEQLEFVCDRAIKDFEGNVITDTYATKDELKLKTSQVYANLTAIQQSGETNKDKIYIAGDTLIPYIYNGKEFTYLNSVKPKGGYNRALFEAAGAVFNEKTGYYELYADEGGLTDITEEQMCDIYTQTAHLAAMSGENYNLFSLTCRTNFKGRVFGNMGINRIYAYGSSNLEILFLDNIDHTFANTGTKVSSFVSDDFYNCANLKRVIGTIRIENVTKDVVYSYSMNLEDIKISGLKVNFNFFAKDSVINYESIKYLIDNAANTSAITITVHPTTYGYLTGTIQPTTQVGGTTEEWQAIVTTATEKQITFATTE